MRSFKEWWKEHRKVRNKMELQVRQELTAYILWYIWKAKNAQKAGKCIEREVVEQAWEEWMEFKEVQMKG